jgi:hypothetical protein
MFAIAAPQKTLASLAEFRARVSAAFSALRSPIFKIRSDRAGHPWFTLDERLLKDIGKSKLDAEIAQLTARWGGAESAASNPLANRRLGA